MIPLVMAAIFVGATFQRITGMGFAMVVAPFVVIALGPAQGIVLVQLCGLTAAGMVLSRVARDVDWSMYGRLLPASLVGVVVGALAVSRVPAAPAQIVTGIVLLIALVVAGQVGASRTVERGTAATAAAGASAGFLISFAGVGGVTLTVFSQLTRWNQRNFSATMQPYFVSISTATVLARVLTDHSSWPPLSLLTWLGLAASMVAGLLLGELVSNRLPLGAARRATVIVAAVGAVLTVVDGGLKW